jgi:hypothetical protein
MGVPEENRNRSDEIRDNHNEGPGLKMLNILIGTPGKVLDLREYLVAPSDESGMSGFLERRKGEN